MRLEALADVSLAPLAQATAKIVREEKYHVMYGEIWLARLAEGDARGLRGPGGGGAAAGLAAER